MIEQTLGLASPGAQLPDLFFTLVLLMIALNIAQAITSYFQTLVTNAVAQNVMNDLRREVFNHLLGMRLRYFDKNAVGSLQTRTISDVETLTNLFSQGFVTLLGQLLELVFLALAMFWIDWRLALIIMAIMPLMILASRVFQVRVKGAFMRVREAVRALNAFTQEHLGGMLVTQVFNREANEEKHFAAINRNQLKANLETVLYYSIYFPVIELIAAIMLAALVWFGANQVLAGSLEFQTLIAFILFSNMFFRPIRMLAERFNELQYGIVSGGRIFEVLDTKEYLPDSGTQEADKALASKNIAIDFENVWFSYSDAENPNWILKGVNFSVAPGTTTAIVGATGSGKSTIISTLMRYYDVQQGSIRLAGRPITDYTLNGLRAALCLVQQDVFLFNGSVLDNITLMNTGISLHKVQQAAKALGAEGFIEKLPGGLHFKVGERGNALSTGQRQLIALIRVMVYDPSILLLDEATANVDTETELLVQRAIETVLKGRTSVIIAHRLSTIQHAQQILVMRAGVVEERGTHAELLAKQGYYYNLHRIQHQQAPVGHNA